LNVVARDDAWGIWIVTNGVRETKRAAILRGDCAGDPEYAFSPIVGAFGHDDSERRRIAASRTLA